MLQRSESYDLFTILVVILTKLLLKSTAAATNAKSPSKSIIFLSKREHVND